MQCSTAVCKNKVRNREAGRLLVLVLSVRGQSSLGASRLSILGQVLLRPSLRRRRSVSAAFLNGRRVAVGKGNLFWATTWKTDRDDRCVTSIDPDHPDSLFPSSSRVRSAERIAAAEAKNWSFRFLSRLCVTRRRIACVA